MYWVMWLSPSIWAAMDTPHSLQVVSCTWKLYISPPVTSASAMLGSCFSTMIRNKLPLRLVDSLLLEFLTEVIALWMLRFPALAKSLTWWPLAFLRAMHQLHSVPWMEVANSYSEPWRNYRLIFPEVKGGLYSKTTSETLPAQHLFITWQHLWQKYFVPKMAPF